MTSEQHSDVLSLRGGRSVTVRFVEPGDAQALQGYFRGLSVRSRYNRLLGAISELPHAELDHFIHAGEDDRFSVVATMTVDGIEEDRRRSPLSLSIPRAVISNLDFRSMISGKDTASGRRC